MNSPAESLAAWQSAFQVTAIATALVVALWLVISALRSGFIKEITFGSFGLKGTITVAELTRIEGVHDSAKEPFEKTALANYYNQALSSSRISFWFSLIFAVIGFLAILFAIATYTPKDISGAAMKVVSGSVIDAVSGLFFVQSTNARKSMTDFFEKLRMDRLNVEAREMIGEIEDPERRDQLRAQLVLKYSGIDKLLTGTESISAT